MSEIQKSKPEYDILALLPLILIVTVSLFMVRLSVYDAGLSEFFWYPGNGVDTDLFGRFKMQVFIGITICSIIYFVYNVLCEGMKVHKEKIYIPMIVFSIFVILSFIFSEHKDIALFGYMERFEGTITIISYMFIMFYAINIINNEKSAKIVIYAFAVSCTILCIWGVMQTLGVDIDKLPRWLIIPSEYRDGELQLVASAKTTRWFFSNQNYTSFFMVIPISIFTMLSIYTEDKKIKVWFALLVGLLFYSLWNASSLGGEVAIVAAVIGAIVLLGFKNIARWWKSIALVLVFAIIATAISLPKILPELKTLTSKIELVKTVYADEIKNISQDVLVFHKLDYLKTEENNIIFGFRGKEINIETKDNDILSIKDSQGNEMSEENEYFKAMSVVNKNGVEYIYIETQNAIWNFVNEDDSVKFISPVGRTITLSEVEHIGFQDNEGFATNRGYIWSRTFPLLKRTFLIGHGADTYAIYFPQDDYAGKSNVNMYTKGININVDKPHNMYLGSAVNTGVISVIALIAIFAVYIVQTFLILRKSNYERFIEFLAAGICIAVIGFLVGGLVNDSTVQIMPVFYVMIGMGCAINRIIARRR